MSILSLFQNNPELIRGSMADVVDAAQAPTPTADYESAAPTGVSDLPSMADVEQWENMLIGLRTTTGQIVTPERAKRNATVLAIMRGLEEDVSSLSAPLYKRGDKQDTIAVDHSVHRIVNVAPNSVMTPMELRGHMMFNMMTDGSFYNLKNFSNDFDTFGDVASVWPLEAVYVTRRWRELVWTFTDPTTGVSGMATPDTLWRGTILAGNAIDGRGITLMCKEAIGMLLAAEEQGARLFSQGIQSDLVIENPGDAMGDEEKKQLRQAFMARHAGSRNAWMPILLEGGPTAKRIGLTAQESQYLEARSFQVSEIARAFRYPEVLLGSTGKSSKSATFASAEQFFDSYTKHTLGPWTTRIEQTIHRDMLNAKEQTRYYIKHDFSTLLRANETARIANWNAKIQGGWAKPSEARKAEGLPWADGLDYFSRPAGSTGTAGGPQSPDPTQTDQSARLARRVALHIYSREEKALVAQKQDADIFYTNFGGYIEGMTVADPVSIRRYLEARRNTPTDARFSVSNMEAALSALTNLCQGQQL